MNTIDSIKTRRSIRKFTDQPVSEETIRQLVEAASFAPSWKNSQPVRYYAVTDADVKAKIGQCTLGYDGNTSNIASAPALIVTTIVHGRSGFERDGSFSTSKEDRWEVFDAGIATQTFCLAAHELGLGTVMMGIFDETQVAEALQLPEGQIAACLVALGYPAEDPKAPKRKDVDALLTVIA